MKLFNLYKNKKEETPNTTVEKSISWLKPEEDLMKIYSQKADKVTRIVKSLEKIGYDRSQLIIAKPNGTTKDGYSRIAAILKYNELHPENKIETVPVYIQDYQDKEDDLLYAIHLSTDRRSLEDDDLFSSFKTFEDFRTKAKSEGKSTKEYSDKNLAETLNISERQISKMRFILKYGSEELHQKILSGECNIAKAEKIIKEEKGDKQSSDRNKNCFDMNSFKQGICVAFLGITNGKSLQDVLSDNRITKDMKSFELTEEEHQQLSKLLSKL